MERLFRTTSLIAFQAFLNLFLAFWLYMEYVHNQFLREYLAGFWTTNYQAVVVLLASGVVGAGSLLLIAWRREFFAKPQTETAIQAKPESPPGLLPLDVCPFCNVSLKPLSGDRFQCRRCGRYFKK